MDVWTDVIDRVRSLNRPGDRERIVHVAYDHIADTHRRQSRTMLCTSHKSTHDRATRDERLDHGLACLAARARDKDHVHRPKGCAILPSLRTERSNDGSNPRFPSQFEQPAWAERNLQELDAAAFQIECVFDRLREQRSARNG